MKRTRFFSMLILATTLAASSAALLSAQNRIIAAPDAVELRKVWEREGRWGLDAEYGWRMWGGTDISGDGIADFAVYQREGEYANTWHFYRGGDPPDTAAYWRMTNVGSQPPHVADFFGEGHLYVIFRDGSTETIDDFTYYYDRLRVFRLSDSATPGEKVIEVDQRIASPPVQRTIVTILKVDVNNDGVDDIVLPLSGKRVGHVREYDHRGQIWIYYGGPDFQLDSPSVIVYDTLIDGTTPGPGWNVEISDIDGDGLLDMVSNGGFPEYLTRFRWGDDNSPLSWTQRPADRELRRSDPQIGLRASSATPHHQIDAHPGADFVGIVANPDKSVSAYIYLSSRQSPRTRSFTFDDADMTFVLPERFSYSEPTGYLNDSQKRFEMLPFERPEFFSDPGSVMFLSGGTDGPDGDYDAYIAPSRLGWALGDVTGDGWGDYGASDPTDGVISSGIATIYAGGPYIPLDDTTLSVREVPVAGESGGLYLWPNPVDDELNIAWRGDLRQMPVRFMAYDARGAVVAEGEVEPGRGKALWNCADFPPGMFILHCFADNGTLIATTEVIKR